MNAKLNRIYPTATPGQLAAMKSDLNTAQWLQKKSEEWDEAHGLGYHLTTLALLPFATLLFPLIMMRLNPYKGAANSHFMRYRQAHDAIAKANGWPTFNENIYGRKARKPRPLANVKANTAASTRPASKTASTQRPALAL
jgi:hypothetical protein